MPAAPASDETQLRALIDELTEGIRTKDAARTTAPYAADTVMYVLDLPLQHLSRNEAPGSGRQTVQQWFDSFQSATIGQEVRDLQLTVGTEVAFAGRLVRISGTCLAGQTTSIWGRATLGFRKLDGRWQITQQHQSVPMYMEGSNRAATDLQP